MGARARKDRSRCQWDSTVRGLRGPPVREDDIRLPRPDGQPQPRLVMTCLAFRWSRWQRRSTERSSRSGDAVTSSLCGHRHRLATACERWAPTEPPGARCSRQPFGGVISVTSSAVAAGSSTYGPLGSKGLRTVVSRCVARRRVADRDQSGRPPRNSTPVARRGRKATGLSESAGLPNGAISMFWDGARWIDERAAAATPPPTRRRGRDWLATGVMIIGVAALAVPFVATNAAVSSTHRLLESWRGSYETRVFQESTPYAAYSGSWDRVQDDQYLGSSAAVSATARRERRPSPSLDPPCRGSGPRDPTRARQPCTWTASMSARWTTTRARSSLARPCSRPPFPGRPSTPSPSRPAGRRQREAVSVDAFVVRGASRSNRRRPTPPPPALVAGAARPDADADADRPGRPRHLPPRRRRRRRLSRPRRPPRRRPRRHPRLGRPRRPPLRPRRRRRLGRPRRPPRRPGRLRRPPPHLPRLRFPHPRLGRLRPQPSAARPRRARRFASPRSRRC